MGEQARWLLDLLAPGTDGPTAAIAERRFSETFLAEVSAEKVEALFDQIRSAAPFSVIAVSPVVTEDGLQKTRIRMNGEEALVMEVAVDGDDMIAGLFFRPDPDATAVPTYGSYEEMDEDLGDLGVAEVYVGEVSEGRCTMSHANPRVAEPAPSGSIFKLIVLSAVADAVAAGEVAWDDKLVLTEGDKSLPSGRLQNRPTGSRLTVRAAARLMISVSDNTAADLLLGALGPDRVGETVEDLRLEADSLRPLLSTRQFFILGWGAPDLARRWSDATTPERERLLEGLPEDLSVVDPAAVTTPVWPQGVGWFLTGEDICRVHARLQEQAAGPDGGGIREILSENPGVPESGEFEYLAFKGGSAPGVVALSYLVEPADGPAQVLVVQIRSESEIDEAAVLSAARGGLALMSRSVSD